MIVQSRPLPLISSSMVRMSANECLSIRWSRGFAINRIPGPSVSSVKAPSALTTISRRAPALSIAVMMLTMLSAHTVVGFRPSRVPMADSTAS
jgi:hypothetical protein